MLPGRHGWTRMLLGSLAIASASGAAIAQPCWWPAAAIAFEADRPSSTTSPASPSARVAPATFADADELLRALEQADRGLVSLTAQVRYSRVFALQGDRQDRFGTLAFANMPAEAGLPARGGARRFAIEFDSLYVGDVQRANSPQIFVFDGEWLIEKNPAERKIIKMQVVAPGETFDPLRIGSGPLPIPIGQKRDDIVSRYNATLVSAEEGVGGDSPEEIEDLKRFVSGTWQILLTPRENAGEREEFREIRLWYTRSADGRLLPRMARTENQARDLATVRLVDVQTQSLGQPPNAAASVTADLFDTRTPTDGWFVDIRPFRRGGE